MHRTTAILLLAAVAVAAAAAPAAAAVAPENPLTTAPWLDARGTLTTRAGDAVPARLTVEGGAGNLTLGGPGDAATHPVEVAWTKARTAPHQSAAWTLTVRADTPRGELVLSGAWTAAPVHGVCTLSYPNTCTYHATGPAALQGTLGDGALSLAGAAGDTYCTQGHLPGNVHMPCGEDWVLA